MSSDFVKTAKSLTFNVVEQLELFVLLTYRDAFPDMPEFVARQQITNAFVSARANNEDFNAYIHEMLHAGIVPDWHRVTPERFLEALYVACRYSPDVRTRMAKEAFQAGADDPLCMLKVFVALSYMEAHPEFDFERADKIAEEAFGRAAARWPDFNRRALALWAIWQGVRPSFELATIDEYLEALWLIAQHASFIKTNQPQAQQQITESWPAEMPTVIQ